MNEFRNILLSLITGFVFTTALFVNDIARDIRKITIHLTGK